MYYGAPFQDSSLWWTDDGSQLFLLLRERAGRSYELIAIDPHTGATRSVITERTDRGIDAFLYWADVNVRVIRNGAQVIWYAQRDGWGHLYLYDAASGDQIRQLTAGAFNVSRIAHVDEAEGWVAFMAVGREPDRDPYLNHLYRVEPRRRRTGVAHPGGRRPHRPVLAHRQSFRRYLLPHRRSARHQPPHRHR